MNRTIVHCSRAIAMSLATLVSIPIMAAEPARTVRPLDAWSNVFAGQPIALRYACEFEPGEKLKFAWILSADNQQVLNRGVFEIASEPGIAKPVELRCEMPPVRDGVVLPARLKVALYADSSAEALASHEKKLWIFPREPFAGRRKWLRDLDIVLFDPVGNTARVFDQAQIPYTRLLALPGENAVVPGILIVGEGLSLAERETVSRDLTRLAVRGSRVLCLAASAGRLLVPGADDRTIPSRLLLEDASIIAQLDDRLDWRSWPPGGPVASRTLRLATDAGSAGAVITNDARGWAWLEEHYEAGGRLIVCQLEIIERWEAGPTPRFLLARILERLADPRGTTDRRRSADPAHNSAAIQEDVLPP